MLSIEYHIHFRTHAHSDNPVYDELMDIFFNKSNGILTNILLGNNVLSVIDD